MHYSLTVQYFYLGIFYKSKNKYRTERRGLKVASLSNQKSTLLLAVGHFMVALTAVIGTTIAGISIMPIAYAVIAAGYLLQIFGR